MRDRRSSGWRSGSPARARAARRGRRCPPGRRVGPSRVAAVSSCPLATSSRVRALETRAPPESSVGASTSSQPRSRPIWRRTGSVPARSRPKAETCVITSAARLRPPPRRVMKSSAVVRRKISSKRCTTTMPATSWAMRSSRSRGSMRRSGAWPWVTASGCGSKVTATGMAASRRAVWSRTRKTCWWPAVDAVEDAHRHREARVGGQQVDAADDLHAQASGVRNTLSGYRRPALTWPMASSRPDSSLTRTRRPGSAGAEASGCAGAPGCGRRRPGAPLALGLRWRPGLRRHLERRWRLRAWLTGADDLAPAERLAVAGADAKLRDGLQTGVHGQQQRCRVARGEDLADTVQRVGVVQPERAAGGTRQGAQVGAAAELLPEVAGQRRARRCRRCSAPRGRPPGAPGRRRPTRSARARGWSPRAASAAAARPPGRAGRRGGPRRARPSGRAGPASIGPRKAARATSTAARAGAADSPGVSSPSMSSVEERAPRTTEAR